MRQGIEAWDISLSLACYFFYTWGGSCFLKRHLQGTVPEARVFAGLLLVCYVALAWGLEGGAVPYILYIFADSIRGLTPCKPFLFYQRTFRKIFCAPLIHAFFLFYRNL